MTLIAHARTTDPETSHEAAASVMNIRQSQQAIYQVLKEHGPMDDVQLVDLYEILPGLPRQSASGIRTRRSELVEMGRVGWTGVKIPLASGRKARLWEALNEMESNV